MAVAVSLAPVATAVPDDLDAPHAAAEVTDVGRDAAGEAGVTRDRDVDPSFWSSVSNDCAVV
jgi:hypothetical protein